jgi:NAD(P)-dependent dehydrogenase (short-subunit alcohol dehydrogenase family)
LNVSADLHPNRSAAAGEVCLVAGATGRLGQAITARLLRQGFTVVGVGRRAAPLERLAADEHVEPCLADLREDGASALIREAVRGRPVRMVVNATRSDTGGDVRQVTTAAVSAAVDLKVGGLLRLVRAADDGFETHSRIVSVGGRLGYDPDPRAAAAGIANAAVANLVRQLAHAYGPRGVTAHVLAPGAVDAAEGGVGHPGGADADVSGAALAAATPLQQLPTPLDVAWAVEILCAPEASFLNGGSLILDGGRRTSIP